MTRERFSGPAGAPSDTHVAARRLGLSRAGRWLFRDMEWAAPRGAFVAVTGPSGAGKSSLLACLAGMLEPSEGAVEWLAADQGAFPPRAMQRRIGIIFQNFMLTPNASVLTNVLCGRLGRYSWPRTLVGFPGRDRREAYGLMKELGLARYAHRRVAAVSGGEQQRTAIARALLQEPEMFLADEPVSNLDAALAERVLAMLRGQADEHRRTVFCVLHNEAQVARFADFNLTIHGDGARGWTWRKVER